MQSNKVIQIRNLGKKYQLGRLQQRVGTYTLRDLITERARRFAQVVRWRRDGRTYEKDQPSIWALTDVSFDVDQGEVVGILGPNGAGKSTLLKVLSRITEPTTGFGEIRGRVGSLLEVGTGFHSELTGRENIYLNGAILGMKRVELKKSFDAIVAFAEVEKFIDTPVKYYSSGMYLRLAFAVAAHLEPEILLVDEVLAVGDASFQKKCLGKMGAVAREGRTVLFVSHNLVAMEGLCDRVIWLENGQIIQDGPSSQIIANYLAKSVSSTTERNWPDPATAPGNEKFRLRKASVRPIGGSPQDPIDVRTDFLLEFEYWNLRPDVYLTLGVQVSNEQGILVFHARQGEEQPRRPIGLFREACRVPADLMNDGMYRVELLVVQDQSIAVYRSSEILTFHIQDSSETRPGWFGKWSGVIRPQLEWKTVQLENDEVTTS